jgi:hypothetical protein
VRKGGGSENLIHTNNLSENTSPFMQHLERLYVANDSRWVYEGKKKSETEKAIMQTLVIVYSGLK